MRFIIVSKGRAKVQHSYNMLVEAGLTDIHIYLYEEDVEAYKETTPVAQLHVGDYSNLLQKRRYILNKYINDPELVDFPGIFLLDDDIQKVDLIKTITAHRERDGHPYKVARPYITDTAKVFEQIPRVCEHYGLAVISAAPQGSSNFSAAKPVFMNKGRIAGMFYWNLTKLRELNYNPYYFEAPNIIEDQYLSLMVQKNKIPYLRLHHWVFKLPDWFTQTGGNIDEYSTAAEFKASKLMELTQAVNEMLRKHARKEFFEGMFRIRKGKSYYYVDYTCKDKKLLPNFEDVLFPPELGTTKE